MSIASLHEMDVAFMSSPKRFEFGIDVEGVLFRCLGYRNSYHNIHRGVD